MSQADALGFLKRYKGGWYTSEEIASKIGISHNSCTANLTSLISHSLVSRRNNIKNLRVVEYTYKNGR